MKSFENRMKAIRIKADTFRSRRRIRRVVTACSLSVVVLLAVHLLAPYDNGIPDVSSYADSPYYDLIQKVNLHQASIQVQYKNRLEKLLAKGRWNLKPGELGGLGAVNNGNGNAGSLPPNDQEMPADSYVEVTDNQTAGVIEADIIKRSDKHVYRLLGETLTIFSIQGKESRQLSRCNISDWYGEFLDKDRKFLASGDWEMYLSRDCKTLTLLGSGNYKDGHAFESYMTFVCSIDVSDPAAPTLKDTKIVEGFYRTSRMMDGQLLLICNYYMDAVVDFSRPETFLPRIGQPGELTFFPRENIELPEQVKATSYTLVVMLQEDGLNILDIKALLTPTGKAYVSEREVILARGYNREEQVGNTREIQAMTDITVLSYEGASLELLGSVTVEGSVEDQHSLDCRDQILRVVTTTAVRKQGVFILYGQQFLRDTTQYNANLYCIDMQSWQVVGMAESFCPESEVATAVRFDGDKAYVCTVERGWSSIGPLVPVDPVFFFDLSDPTHITWTDTGFMEGFSEHLIQFGNHTVVGVGAADSKTLKIEAYRQGTEQVDILHSYQLKCRYSDNYKSLLIDREQGLVGLIVSYDGKYSQYVLLQLTEKGFAVLVDAPCGTENSMQYLDESRSFIQDGFVYAFTDIMNVIEL